MGNIFSQRNALEGSYPIVFDKDFPACKAEYCVIAPQATSMAQNISYELVSVSEVETIQPFRIFGDAPGFYDQKKGE